MSWGIVEVEPEIRDWYLSLDESRRSQVRLNIGRLESLGPLLDEPHTRQWRGKVRELRCFVGGRPMRITYWIASGRRIVLLTVFEKKARREPR